jgi:hypothetical protein
LGERRKWKRIGEMRGNWGRNCCKGMSGRRWMEYSSMRQLGWDEEMKNGSGRMMFLLTVHCISILISTIPTHHHPYSANSPPFLSTSSSIILINLILF